LNFVLVIALLFPYLESKENSERKSDGGEDVLTEKEIHLNSSKILKGCYATDKSQNKTKQLIKECI
jgi:hypothetical protein